MHIKREGIKTPSLFFYLDNFELNCIITMKCALSIKMPNIKEGKI
jgi:hypothetical protein